jgi:hypothetical protein
MNTFKTKFKTGDIVKIKKPTNQLKGEWVVVGAIIYYEDEVEYMLYPRVSRDIVLQPLEVWKHRYSGTHLGSDLYCFQEKGLEFISKVSKKSLKKKEKSQ